MPRPVQSLTDFVAGTAPKPAPRGQWKPAVVDKPAKPAAPVPNIESAYRALAMAERAIGDLRSTLTVLQGQVSAGEEQTAPVAPINQTEPRVAYRLGEAAKLLGVSPRVLSREVHSGALPARITGKIIIISHAALQEYARGGAHQSPTP